MQKFARWLSQIISNYFIITTVLNTFFIIFISNFVVLIRICSAKWTHYVLYYQWEQVINLYERIHLIWNHTFLIHINDHDASSKQNRPQKRLKFNWNIKRKIHIASDTVRQYLSDVHTSINWNFHVLIEYATFVWFSMEWYMFTTFICFSCLMNEKRCRYFRVHNVNYEWKLAWGISFSNRLCNSMSDAHVSNALWYCKLFIVFH